MNISYQADWVHAIRLLITFLITVALGLHAFYRFKELNDTNSPRVWVFLLYSMVFLVSSALNFVSLMVTVATRTYGRNPAVSVGGFTLMLIITYSVVAYSTRPSRDFS